MITSPFILSEGVYSLNSNGLLSTHLLYGEFYVTSFGFQQKFSSLVESRDECKISGQCALKSRQETGFRTAWNPTELFFYHAGIEGWAVHDTGGTAFGGSRERCVEGSTMHNARIRQSIWFYSTTHSVPFGSIRPPSSLPATPSDPLRGPFGCPTTGP